MVIYRTNEYEGYGSHNTYWYEYRLEGNTVYKYKCHEYKMFNGEENECDTTDKLVESWDINDNNMPDWLKKYL